MQTVSFKIGDEKKRDLRDVASIYKQTISQQGSSMGLHFRDTRSVASLKNSNINFGNEKKVDYVSEAKEKFIPVANSALSFQNPREMAKLFRGNNFKFQETNTNYFETVKKIDFNYKGEARFIRSTIPNEVKADQRASHFRVGFENQSPFVNQQNPYAAGERRPSSAAIPAVP